MDISTLLTMLLFSTWVNDTKIFISPFITLAHPYCSEIASIFILYNLKLFSLDNFLISNLVAMSSNITPIDFLPLVLIDGQILW